MKIMHVTIDCVMYVIYMYSTYVCITYLSYRIYELNIQMIITNREGIVLASAYIVRQNIVR